eukprot:gene7271-383_t
MSTLTEAYEWAVQKFLNATENGIVPDVVLRSAIRYLLSVRAAEGKRPLEHQMEQKLAFIEELRGMPVAINTADANEQHYEIPTEYYLLCLGKHLKYSSCFYKTPSESLSEAEENMLTMYCQRADLKDGVSILELGCGWGSFSLFAAAAFPKSQVTAVSNSATQKEFIDKLARDRGLKNLQVITANVVNFEAPGQYDRIVSIEMFEHMKNYGELMKRCSSWLKTGGKMFVHIFSAELGQLNRLRLGQGGKVHESIAYLFEAGTSVPSL